MAAARNQRPETQQPPGGLRVGMVTGEYPPMVGGVGDHTARLAGELAGLGHAVHVVTSLSPAVHPAESPAAARAARVPTAAAPPATRPVAQDHAPTGGAGPGGPRVSHLIRRWDWRIFASLSRHARREAWDVLHIQYQPGAYALHPAITLLPQWLRLSLAGPAIVTTFHDRRVPYLFPKAGPLRELAVRQLARGSDGIIAAAEDDVIGLLGWVAGRRRHVAVAHIPLGNQFDVAPPGDFDRELWRAVMGLTPDTFVIGHFGFVNRRKAIDELVRALGTLVRLGREVHLVMIGDEAGSSDTTNQAYVREVRRLVAELQLGRRVHWTGFQSPAAVAGWLRCMDVVALPFRDGASLGHTSLIAAWAQGTPVLTTQPSGAADWLRGPQPAAIVPFPGAEALATALAQLQDHPAHRAELGALGKAFAGRFDWPEVARRTIEVYYRALATRQKRSANA